MRVLVKRGHSLINDLRFEQGPIYIGRQPKSQIFLPDRAVSRQHAAIFTTPDGTWIVQDLDSVNRTVVNSRPISKWPLHEGDVITIADFMIEVHFEQHTARGEDKPLDLGDTLAGSQAMPSSIYIHKASRGHEHVIRLAPNRITDIYYLCVSLCKKDDQETLLTELNQKLLKQFNAYHIWTGLRETTSGPLTSYGGLSRGGNLISLEQLVGKNIIKQAVQDESYILLPNIADIAGPGEIAPGGLENLRSAMAAPITAPAGIYGIIYLDNGADQEAYSHQDLDYLTLVSTQVAAFLEHIG
jgi:pSer/pThr/pTyr-binding forkhead associated (FHA) protein